MADRRICCVRRAKRFDQFMRGLSGLGGPAAQYFFVSGAMPGGYGGRMELRHLRYFEGVARELNFTRAAQQLHVAQPALSRQIRQLEEELGVKLLERTSRGVQLTEAGRAFRAEACALLQQSEQAIRVARQQAPAAGGLLNLGYIWGLFHSIVPPLVERFRRQYPETAVHLFDLMPLEQARALKEGRLDAGFIGFADEPDAAGLNKRQVGRCAFVVALPKDHRAARKARVPLASLADEFFLGISDQTYPGASRHVSEACRRAGFRPRIVQMVERGYTILGLVAARCGIAVLPESLKALPHSGVVFRPLTDPPVADLFLAWHADGPPSRPHFLEALDRAG
jgi:LysR family transcriptional regulator, benzoate and cis,cis-muconate-responsive activator of ben and cat genes